MESNDVSKTKTNPVTQITRQVLLGTLLGDGSMQWNTHTNPEYGRFYITHGVNQEAYCRHKAEVLKDYVRTPPAIRKNQGWGNKSCVFTTVTSPAFEFLRSLCYKPNLKTGRLMKWVTPEWVDQLDPVGLAYWYMDDGSIGTKQASILLNTQSFTKKCVLLLTRKLKTFGFTPSVNAYRKRGKKQKYWVIMLGAKDTRAFVELVRPHMHESMEYKLIVRANSSIEMVVCQFCGESTPRGPRSDNPDNMIACQKPECRAAKHRIVCSREDREHVKARAKKNYHKNLEQRREYNKLLARKLMSDPNYREKVNEKKKARRTAARVNRPVRMTNCQFCDKSIPWGNRREGTMIACSNPECKRQKHRIICKKNSSKLKSSQLSTPGISESGT